MLNHAARTRVLSDRGGPFDPPSADDQADEYRIELEITGIRRPYLGDAQVWMWYRGGTAIGPRPCMSALLALEQVCDEVLAAGVPLENLGLRPLADCGGRRNSRVDRGNAQVRNLEVADRLLDPFLREPEIWEVSDSRVSNERLSGATPSEESAVDRRLWSLSDAAMRLVLNAEGTRIDELREIGNELVTNARSRVEVQGT